MKWLKILLIIMIAVSAGCAGAFLRVAKLVTPVSEDIKETTSFNEASGTINILLAGTDSTDGTHRSDTIALATIEIDTKSISIMSIPRDSRVFIPNRRWEKINHAYAYGGIKLLRDVLVNMLGIPINYYVIVNFDSFPTIVDIIGGVTIDVEKRLHYTDRSQNLFIDIPKGVQTLDGKKALQYARFRNDALGDIGRIARQQKFVKEVLRKLQSPEILPKLPDLAQEILHMVNTDMSVTQTIQLASYLKDVGEDRMKFFMMPGKVGYVGSLSYWLPDIQATSMMLAGEQVAAYQDDIKSSELQVDAEALIGMISGKVAILNGDGSRGLGKRASEELQKLGIDVGLTGNAKHFDYRSSVVVMPTNASEIEKESAEALAELCGIDKKLVTRSGAVSSVTIIFGKDKERVFGKLRNAREKSI